MARTLTVLSAGSIRRGVDGVARVFEARSGAVFAADYSSAPKVKAQMLAGAQADVVIASASALDALAREGKIVGDKRVVIGPTRMALALHRDCPKPDISTTEAFWRVMLDAEIVAYNEGSSGIHSDRLVDRLQLRAPLGERVRVVKNGAEMFKLITDIPGRVYGWAHVTNIVDAIALGVPVAPAIVFPEELQNITRYDAAVSANCSEPELAEAFLATFASTEGRAALAAAGIEQ